MPTISTTVTEIQTESPLFVDAGGAVRTLDTPAVRFEVDSAARLTNEGRVVSSFQTAVEVDLGTAGGAVAIVNSGRIAGASGIFAEDVAETSSSLRIVNDGVIAGAPGGVAIGSGAATTRITNSGRLEGELLLGGERIAVVNDGGIIGAMFIDAEVAGIRNAGRLTNDIQMLAGDLVFDNAAGASGRALYCSESASYTIRVSNAGTMQRVDLGGGDDVYRATGAGRASDGIFGADGNDRLIGADANDRMEGGFGDDALVGAGGRDALSGGYGADGMFGGEAQDTLSGGAGRDVIAGGEGADTFQLASDSEIDFITDFSAAERDKLDLSVFQLGGFDDPDLVIVQTLTRTIVVVGDAQFRLKGLVDLDAGDFVF